MPPSCALLGGFAIGAQVVLLWQHNANAKSQRVLCTPVCLVIFSNPIYTVAHIAKRFEPNTVFCVCDTLQQCS